MLYRGQVLNGVDALALIEEREAEIERLRDLCGEYTRELIILRAPQAGMVCAALNGAGFYGEPTVDQYEVAVRALNKDRGSGSCWFDMCAALRADLGLPPEEAKVKGKKKRAA